MFNICLTLINILQYACKCSTKTSGSVIFFNEIKNIVIEVFVSTFMHVIHSKPLVKANVE